MAGITLSQAEAQLTVWINASTAVAAGQEYRIGDRSLKRANLADIQSQITFWNAQVQRLTRGGIRVIGATPN